MKYKLIKNYPGCPFKIGEIAGDQSIISDEHFCVNRGVSEYTVYPKEYVENNPEFWEKVIESEYVITSVINPKGIILTYDGETCIKRSDGTGAEFTVPLQRALSELYDCKIFSIKREKDGEVFTIGDKVSGLSLNCVIDEIWLNPGCPTQILFNHLDEGIELEDATKLKPLFITEDGVDIYDGDKYWLLWIKDLARYQDVFKLYTKSATKLTSNESWSEDAKFFSTKEKAEEYLLMNKPCLSINEVLSVGQRVIVDEGKLKQLVKSKLMVNSGLTKE